MLDGFGGRFSPCEGSVAGDQNSGNGNRVEAFGAKAAEDDSAGVADVGGGDFLGGEPFSDGNRAMEVVGVGGSQARDWLAGLGPGGCELGMSVNDTAYLGEFAIEQSVGVEIARGAQVALDDFAVEIGDDQVGRSEGGIIDAAGFDDDQGLRAGAVDAAGVAEGMGGEAAAGDFLVGFEEPASGVTRGASFASCCGGI